MPNFTDIERERMIEAWLRRMFGKMIPTLQDAPTFQGDAVSPTIMLYPTNEGSRMPQAQPDDLMRRSRTRGSGGPA